MQITFSTGILEGMDDAFSRTDLAPGTSEWKNLDGNRWLCFICPCGCSAVRHVPVEGPKKWNWDGNLELPTLTPSIQIVGECKWHGFLTAGQWRTV